MLLREPGGVGGRKVPHLSAMLLLTSAFRARGGVVVPTQLGPRTVEPVRLHHFFNLTTAVLCPKLQDRSQRINI
jgi:hypothetical protein